MCVCVCLCVDCSAIIKQLFLITPVTALLRGTLNKDVLTALLRQRWQLGCFCWRWHLIWFANLTVRNAVFIVEENHCLLKVTDKKIEINLQITKMVGFRAARPFLSPMHINYLAQLLSSGFLFSPSFSEDEYYIPPWHRRMPLSKRIS